MMLHRVNAKTLGFFPKGAFEEHAKRHQIFAGSKTVELRRVCPKVLAGDLALVYVSSPVMELRGSFEVAKILTASPAALWKQIGKKAGVTKVEFFTYFRGKKRAHALVIKKAWKLDAPIGLTTLQQRKGGFRPPQNFHYMNRNESSLRASFVIAQNN
jgi:predicted transcriptional regulator